MSKLFSYYHNALPTLQINLDTTFAAAWLQWSFEGSLVLRPELECRAKLHLVFKRHAIPACSTVITTIKTHALTPNADGYIRTTRSRRGVNIDAAHYLIAQILPLQLLAPWSRIIACLPSGQAAHLRMVAGSPAGRAWAAGRESWARLAGGMACLQEGAETASHWA